MKLVATKEKVQIKWFVWTGGEMFPRESNMRYFRGFDAKCSCGWETKTGGAIQAYVKKQVDNHKWLEHDYQYEISFRKSQSELLVEQLQEIAGA